MRIVTSRNDFLDIDGYAGCVAYAELMQLQGHDARAVCEAPWNESVSRSVREWDAPLATAYASSPDDTFTIIDVSDPVHFEKFVVLDHVREVIDHHPGLEQYWEQNLGDRAHIEFIGAACTQVYERWEAAGLLDKISTTSARLLIAGILDNTLNFGAKITTVRDKSAYNNLLKHAKLPNNWTTQYFTECQASILANVSGAITNDTKILTFASLPGKLAAGQLVVWDTSEVLYEHKATIEQTLAKINPSWFINLVNVGERRSFFVSNDTKIQAWLSRLLDVQFNGSVAKAERLWLRKEIMKADIEATSSQSVS